MTAATAADSADLLRAALAGDHHSFAREDSVEETWRIVQPLRELPPAVQPYEPGMWGPETAAGCCAVMPAGRNRGAAVRVTSADVHAEGLVVGQEPSASTAVEETVCHD